MERVLKIAKASTAPMPDQFFWYTICVALFAFVIWATLRYIDNIKATFDKHGDLITKMGSCIIELTTITKVHEVHIQAILKDMEKQGEDLESLREFYIVKYKDNGR